MVPFHLIGDIRQYLNSCTFSSLDRSLPGPNYDVERAVCDFDPSVLRGFLLLLIPDVYIDTETDQDQEGHKTLRFCQLRRLRRRTVGDLLQSSDLGQPCSLSVGLLVFDRPRVGDQVEATDTAFPHGRDLDLLAIGDVLGANRAFVHAQTIRPAVDFGQ